MFITIDAVFYFSDRQFFILIDFSLNHHYFMKQIKKSYVFTEKKSFFFKYIILYEKNTSKEIRYNSMHKNQ